LKQFFSTVDNINKLNQKEIMIFYKANIYFKKMLKKKKKKRMVYIWDNVGFKLKNWVGIVPVSWLLSRYLFNELIIL